MVKNNKQQAKKNRLKQWYKDYKTLFLIVSIPLILFAVGFGVFSAYKFNVMREDKKDFDVAEARLRQLSLPKAASTEYFKACSYRSSKDVIRTNPICRISRKDTYTNITASTAIKKKYANTEYVEFSTPLKNFICGTGMLPYPSSENIELVSSCGKRVKFQLYMESD